MGPTGAVGEAFRNLSPNENDIANSTTSTAQIDLYMMSSKGWHLGEGGIIPRAQKIQNSPLAGNQSHALGAYYDVFFKPILPMHHFSKPDSTVVPRLPRFVPLSEFLVGLRMVVLKQHNLK
jgi:hypothetical protein